MSEQIHTLTFPNWLFLMYSKARSSIPGMSLVMPLATNDGSETIAEGDSNSIGFSLAESNTTTRCTPSVLSVLESCVSAPISFVTPVPDCVSCMLGDRSKSTIATSLDRLPSNPINPLANGLEVKNTRQATAKARISRISHCRSLV